MGRETECAIRWGSATSHGKVLLENAVLIFRGGIQRRLPLATITALTVHGDDLLFEVEGVRVALTLGSLVARAWQKAIQTPPPTLASKLGITSATGVFVWGKIDAEELSSALAVASGTSINLVLMRASTPQELESGLGACWQKIEAGFPVWIVYPKGKISTLGETAVRDKMRALNLIDTKVASVSATLTALRFIQRKT